MFISIISYNRTNYQGLRFYKKQNIKKISYLLNCGTLQDKRTALHFATWRGNKDIVEQLVEYGANVNLQDEVYNIL